MTQLVHKLRRISQTGLLLIKWCTHSMYNKVSVERGYRIKVHVFVTEKKKYRPSIPPPTLFGHSIDLSFCFVPFKLCQIMETSERSLSAFYGMVILRFFTIHIMYHILISKSSIKLWVTFVYSNRRMNVPSGIICKCCSYAVLPAL